MIIEESEYQGKPVLVIKNDENDKYPFSFGVGKAKKVLAAIEEIKSFVAKHDKP
jgi:CO dehydrogenase nickel-insertion accessory protein CooC1